MGRRRGLDIDLLERLLNVGGGRRMGLLACCEPMRAMRGGGKGRVDED